MLNRRRPVSWQTRLIFEIIPVLILLSLFFWYIDVRVYPAVESIAEHQARGYAAQVINIAVAHELKTNMLEYGEIITVTHSTSGEITSVQTNMATIGKLQTALAEEIIAQIEMQQNREFEIPIGTLFGNPLLSGRGPALKIKVMPVGSMETKLEHQFVDAGINQTLHRIMLIVQIDIQTILPGKIMTTTTQTGYCIAETVIVGEVPQGYTQINGDDSSVISKINDYGTQQNSYVSQKK